MNKLADSKHRLRQVTAYRFSTVQLLIALALLLISAPFVEELEGGHLILSILFSLVLLAAVFAVANRKRSLAIALVLAIPAIIARWINQLRPDLVHPATFLLCALVLLAFVIGHLRALHSACAGGECGSALCQHRGLPDARLNMDGRILAGGSVDAWRGLFFQHESRRAIDERIHRIVF